jgi:hypothetical protein
MSSNIFPTTGAIKITDMRILNNNVVHISGNETISGQKTFNDTLTTNQIINTGTLINNGDIRISGNLLTSGGIKYLRLLNISNYYNSIYSEFTENVNSLSYQQLDISQIININLLTNTFLTKISTPINNFIFNEIGDYYVSVNMIFSIDSTIIKNMNINFSFDGSTSIAEQDVNIFNFKYQVNLSKIYNITNTNTQNLQLYIKCLNNITFKIHKINIDIIKLN